MISRDEKQRITTLLIFIGLIFILDILVVVSNIYVAPVLDGIGLPSIVLYVKTIYFGCLFLVLLYWTNKKSSHLTIDTLRLLLFLGLFIIIFYFISLFIYKFTLLDSTLEIIEEKILGGNPALALDFSRINRETLTYVITIFSGFNSEFFLLIQTLIMVFFYMKSKEYSTIEDNTIVSDNFMFDKWLFPLFSLALFLSLGTANVLSLSYDFLGSIENGISLFAFLATLGGLISSIRVKVVGSDGIGRYRFSGFHSAMYASAILSIIAASALFILNFYFIAIDRVTYRVGPSVFFLVTSIVLFLRIRNIRKIDSK